MNESGLIKLKSIVQDLIFKPTKVAIGDKSVTFYAGIIESAFSQQSLFCKTILNEAEKLIKDIENKKIRLNDSTAISALLALRLLGVNNQKFQETINTYLDNRLSDFAYSPLEDAMMLFLLSQCVDYLKPSIKEKISNKLTHLKATSYTFENECLIYASYLVLSKNSDNNLREKSAEKFTRYKPKEMTLSQGVYALWFYEIYISPYLNTFEILKPQIEKWNSELKKEIIPRLHQELSSKSIDTRIDEESYIEPVSISDFELALIYETILRNDDKFLIISQQDFTNSLIEKSKNIYLGKLKWQSYFWILLLMIFFIFPWYLLSNFNLRILIPAMIGIFLVIIIFLLRYKHIKYSLIEKREWITANYKNLLTSLLFGISVVYITSFIKFKEYFQVKLPETFIVNANVFLGIIAVLLAHLKGSLMKILNDLLFSIKIPNELKGDDKK